MFKKLMRHISSVGCLADINISVKQIVLYHTSCDLNDTSLSLDLFFHATSACCTANSRQVPAKIGSRSFDTILSVISLSSGRSFTIT
jgi:hypothetical protein